VSRLHLQILGLSSDASETEINKAYRKLARQYHPDMPTGDVDMFQKVKKAHDALTDEVIKENYRLYGNPDGRQALEVSIGLPNFLKGGFSGWFLVLFYMALLVGFLPYLAFRFYRKNKDKNSTTGLHEGSHFWLSNRLATFPEGTTVRLMPEIIGGCIDFTMDHKVPADDGSNSLGNPFNHAGLKELLNQCRKEGLFTDVTPSDPQKNRNRWIVPKEYVARHALLLLAHCNKSKLAASQVLKGLTTDQLIVQLSMLKQMTKICDLMIQMCVELEATTERRAMMAAQRADIPSSQKPQPVRYFEAIRNIAVFQQLVSL
jgi:curved DNA-binding protein CbpA